jgi:hypothetical protein
VINQIRADVWRYISQAAQREEELSLEASALLQMTPAEVRSLGRIQFILSDAAGRLIDGMHSLSRRLATTAIPEEEHSFERVRGPIRWGATLAERAASGMPHLYVTAPARRAFQTPENEVLVHALDAIRDEGKRTGWYRKGKELAPVIRERVNGAERWLRTRSLSEVEQHPITPRLVARVRTGRAARRYAAAIEVTQLHRKYLRRLDRNAIRSAVENFALVASADEVLLELLVLFAVEHALDEQGWEISLPGVVSGGGVALACRRGDQQLEVSYQSTPAGLSRESRYGQVQRIHGFAPVGPLRPDLVLRFSSGHQLRWVIVEVKGIQREVKDSARAALQNLLAYRRAFDPALSGQTGTYGLGIAWGEDLAPRLGSEVMLCSPDTVGEALALLTA